MGCGRVEWWGKEKEGRIEGLDVDVQLRSRRDAILAELVEALALVEPEALADSLEGRVGGRPVEADGRPGERESESRRGLEGRGLSGRVGKKIGQGNGLSGGERCRQEEGDDRESTEGIHKRKP